MHHHQKYVLLGFVASCIAVCTGCVSRQVGTAMAPVVAQAIVELSTPPLGLARGANEFRVTKGRWPKNYPELISFLKDSHSETYQNLQAVRFNRIQFSDATNGWLKVTAEYPLPSGVGVTYSGGTVTLNDMMISPIDPQELKVEAHAKEKRN